MTCRANHEKKNSASEPRHNVNTLALRALPAIEGWTLSADDAGGHWVRDLDLAERAELVNPRDIRTHIKKALAEGAFTIVADGDNGDSPQVREVLTTVAIGSGASRAVTEFYLNEAAALLLVMRLRTPKAIEVTKTVVRVFLAASRGELVPFVAAPVADAAIDEGERTRDMIASLFMKIETLTHSVAALGLGGGLISYEQDQALKGEVETLANMRLILGYNTTFRGAVTAMNQRVASAAEWGGTGTRRASMPADRLPRVRVALQNIRADLEADARRRKVSLKGAGAGKPQGNLFLVGSKTG